MRTLVVVAIAGAVTWGAWSTLAVDAPPARPPASPMEALQREILHAGIDQPGDPALGEIYQALNARHFAAALPAMSVRWEPRLRDVSSIVDPSFTLQGMFGRVGSRMTILVNPALKDDRAALDRTLSHEMVHAHLEVTGHADRGHGPAFQAVLRRLASEGAFEGMVATDEERRQLRAWLDAESARLAADREAIARRARELDQERADLEQAIAAAGGLFDQAQADALNARRDAYNSNAMRANDQVAMHEQAVAVLNREIARYNLMVQYPDGLDETAMVKPPTP